MSNILTNNINARSGNTITIGKAGDLVSIAGSLSYEDVTSVDSVGVITARSDVSIADKIIHTGDTNTAIRFPAADTFTVETAGSERVRVSAGGSVGIGTTDPTEKLSIENGNIFIRDTSDNESFIYFTHSPTANRRSYIGAVEGTGNSNALVFATNANGADAVEKLRITPAGRVGIGTDSPTVLLELESTSPTIRLTDSDATGTPECQISGAGGDLVFEADRDNQKSDSQMRFAVDGTERVRIDNSGRVGINTTGFADTAVALNIKNGSSGSEHTFLDIECDNNETCRVRFSENGSTYPGEIRYFHSDNSMRFFRGGTEHMRMDGQLRTFHSDASARFTVKNANTSSGSSAFDISNNATGVTDGTQVFSIRENGDIYTSGNTTVQALSSERRLKENIELIDRSVSWATIKNTPYYTYNLIGQEGPRYGPIVDEVPAEMVKETDLSDDQGPIRTFDNGMLNARLYVALQEAIAKIETLETKVAALEGN